MKEYAVKVTEAAEGAIYDQARYIAVERQEPLNATRWLARYRAPWRRRVISNNYNSVPFPHECYQDLHAGFDHSGK